MTAPVERSGARQLAGAGAARAGPADPVGASASRTIMVRLERKEGLPRIVVRDRGSGEEHLHLLRRGGLLARPVGVLRIRHRRSMRFSYSSMTTPAQVFDYNMTTPRAGAAARPRKCPPATTRTHYVTRRLMAPAPTASWCRSRCLTIATRRSTASAPCLLYGYGSYGITDAGRIQHQLAVAGRPRLRLCHRPCPRRQGQGLCAGTTTASGRRR